MGDRVEVQTYKERRPETAAEFARLGRLRALQVAPETLSAPVAQPHDRPTVVGAVVTVANMDRSKRS